MDAASPVRAAKRNSEDCRRRRRPREYGGAQYASRRQRATAGKQYAYSPTGSVDPSIADQKGYTKGKLSQQHAFANLDGSPDYP